MTASRQNAGEGDYCCLYQLSAKLNRYLSFGSGVGVALVAACFGARCDWAEGALKKIMKHYSPDFLTLEPIEAPPSVELPGDPISLELNSTSPLPLVDIADAPKSTSGFWLSGGAIMCGCPDCDSPMSVRLWLLLADCWKCGTSIEISEEQEAEIRQLIDQPKPATKHRSNGHSRAPAVAAPEPEVPAARLLERKPKSRPAPPPRNQPPAAALTPAGMPSEPYTSRSLFRELPAWFISMLIHAILLTLLAFLTFMQAPEDQYITLSTSVSSFPQEGEEHAFDSNQEVQYDLPVPKEQLPQDAREREAMVRANQDARALRVDPDGGKSRPKLSSVKNALRSPHPTTRSLAARDPRVRIDIVAKEGGTTLTEAAVSRGLRWLARHQGRDGRWSLNRFHRDGECNGRCSGQGHIRSDSAATSLCLLPFLGAGQTHLAGQYQDVVAHGLQWLITNQGEDGDLRIDSQGNAGMYAHGQGAIVLCEAFGMTHDETIRDPAQRSIDFIVQAQHRRGGWRYSPGERGDTSVVGWQVMALQSAKMAGLKVPPETMELADQYLDSVSSRRGSRYAYQPNQSPTHVMTAEALLCRMYLGWRLNDPGIQKAIDYLVDNHPPEFSDANIYYWYYATQVMHHAGGKPWKIWNQQMRDILVAGQKTRGHEAGSWDPTDRHALTGGRIYTTALAVCTLEVYYRHAPIFRQLDVD